MNLKNKNILLAVSGGIAAYKSCELVRLLIKKSAKVRVMMTKSACQFIKPLTFEVLTNHAVLTELFPERFSATHHIDWADWADCIIVAPATANIIGKLANGLSDDIVTTIICAARAPKLVAPAMNTNMLTNSIIQQNIEQLKQHQYTIMGTASGELACGWIGEGRLADLSEIIQYTYRVLAKKKLQGKKILVSSGPTIEDIDPVRFLSNRSSGKMGNALAFSAWAMGADVTLVSGKTAEILPYQIQSISIRSASEMSKVVQHEFKKCDVFISAAAVADYTSEEFASEKIKKSKSKMLLPLVQNEDILKSLKKKNHQVVIGFAMETSHAEENARMKLVSKNLDAIVVNKLSEKGAGFEHNTNVAKILFPDGRKISLEIQSKLEIAFKIWNSIF